MSNNPPKGIVAGQADVGRRVIYRAGPAWDAEPGVITSIGGPGSVHVRYDGKQRSESTSMCDLDWVSA